MLRRRFADANIAETFSENRSISREPSSVKGENALRRRFTSVFVCPVVDEGPKPPLSVRLSQAVNNDKLGRFRLTLEIRLLLSCK